MDSEFVRGVRAITPATGHRFHATARPLAARSSEMQQTEIIELTKLAAPRRPSFGEFLVEHEVLDRFQLFRVLQMQDRVPGTRLGHCVGARGYAPRAEIEQLHDSYAQKDDATIEEVDLDALATTAFEREIEP